MDIFWISPKELASGAYGFPKLSIQFQNKLRKNNEITFAKVGRNIVYKKAWIEEYLERNIKKADGKADNGYN
jgi:hypothetical protein